MQSRYSLRAGRTVVSIGITSINSTTAIPVFYMTLHAKTIRRTLNGETHPIKDLLSPMEVMNTGALKTDSLLTRLIILDNLKTSARRY